MPRTDPQTRIQDYCNEQNAALTRRIFDLTSENTRLAALVATHEQALVNALQEAGATIEQLKNEKLFLEEAIKADAANVENAAGSMQELRNEIASLKKATSAYETDLELATAEAGKLREFNQEIKVKLEAAEKELNKAPIPAPKTKEEKKADKQK